MIFFTASEGVASAAPVVDLQYGNTELADMRLMALVIVSSLAVATAACATNRTDLTETGSVDVQIDGGPRSAVRYVNVYFDDQGGETVIRGKVSDTGFYPRYVKHVHVKVVSPDNKVILEERPRLIWQKGPRKRGIQTGSTGSGRFTVRLPQAVPSGTVVQVVYHDTFHPDANSAG
jgi:hypothetical protein